MSGLRIFGSSRQVLEDDLLLRAGDLMISSANCRIVISNGLPMLTGYG
jgi:hypothetical protein